MRTWLALGLVLSGLTMLLTGCTPAHAVRQLTAARQGPVSVRITAQGRTLPMLAHGGRLYVLGERGVRYQILIRNHTRQRLEVFVAVDGRDVITGQVARPHRQRGYILNPYRYVSIPGFRTSQQSVAAFRFSTPGRAYAAYKGSAGAIGQIRVLVFQEKSHSLLLPRLSRNSVRPQQHYKSSTGAGGRSRPSSKDSSPSVRQRTGKNNSLAKRSYRYWHRPTPRPGLGTAFGGRVHAPAQFTTFHRASQTPMTKIRLDYDNCAGLARRGVMFCYKPKPCARPCVPSYDRKTRYATPPVR